MLNANHLGAKGEARFAELCEDAQLVCNKSNRDLTGWDFIVEFPFTRDGQPPAILQNRPAPLSCHVQVKTLQDTTERFQTRLSSAERLAKEPKPAFVLVFKVNSILEFVDACLIHVLDEPLGKILRRLREADAKGAKVTNDTTISWSPEAEGTRIPITGVGLKEAIETFCGRDMHAYVLKKEEQLRKLGFDERPFKMSLSLHVQSEEDLTDAFLGLRKEIQASDVEGSEVRFGIELPIEGMTATEARLTIQPLPVDQCTIVGRRNPLARPVVFRADMFLPAIPSREFKKALIRTDLFSITVQDREFKLTSNETPEPQTPSTWADYWRLYEMLAVGEGVLELTPVSVPTPIPLRMSNATSSLDAAAAAYWLNRCEQLSALLKVAGILAEPRVTLEMIAGSREQIASAHELLAPTGDKPILLFATAWNDALASALDRAALYVDHLCIGDVTLGYYATGRMLGTRNNDQVDWVLSDVTLLGMTTIQNFPQEFDRFVKEAQKVTGIESAVVRAPTLIEQAPSLPGAESGGVEIERESPRA